jgi:hypothetical protein
MPKDDFYPPLKKEDVQAAQRPQFNTPGHLAKAGKMN